MNEYRAYVIGPDGHFVSCRAHVCPDDTHAITWATQLLDGRPVELWSGERFLIRLEPAE